MSIDRRTDSLLRLPDVRARTGLSSSSISRREAAGTFPRRVRIGENSVAWYLSDIEDFVVDPLNYRAAADAA
jgi:prophage regulatory protein